MPGSALRSFHERFIVETRPVAASVKRNLYIISAVLVAAGLVFFFVILSSVLQKDDLSSIDAPIESWIDARRADWLTAVMIGIAVVFGPIALPIIILVVTVSWGIFARHIWRPLLLALGTLTGVIVVQIITRLVGRERPPTSLMLFGTDTTFSFPSGHVLGACDFLLLLTYLVFSRKKNPRVTVTAFAVAALLIFAAAACRVYLGYHWATDALASMSLSLVILGLIIALDTYRTVRVVPPAVTVDATRTVDATGTVDSSGTVGPVAAANQETSGHRRARNARTPQ
ncbi:phosphatase PAP2 family protein [Subtercola sp. PAMC28395]|uniref:phosphatase PAP2 family protein n=1 Tax=Subtercola sp. PAMC28395 TaxID=2846775 RepID=UPI001C0BD9E5|nr:phosphatase PAP2 family protein [Subtercola sp. PAMC28395]QWT22714.1 phosphatase PAP2 family protein [Subtercola sp. PAMC28395]